MGEDGGCEAGGQNFLSGRPSLNLACQASQEARLAYERGPNQHSTMATHFSCSTYYPRAPDPRKQCGRSVSVDMMTCNKMFLDPGTLEESGNGSAIETH